MANPQIDNGYTKIANEIYDALCKIRIPGEAHQILHVVIRKTYGFNKKQDWIALSQFCLMTGLKRPNVCRAINKLKIMNIIIVIQKDNGDIRLYRFNKDFDTWKPLSKKITLSKKIMSVIQKDNEALSKKIHTKDNTTKDNIQKTVADKSASLDFKEIIAYYHTLVLNSEGFKPEIRAKDCALVKSILKRYPKDQVKDIIYQYLSGEKASKLGIDLSIALSAHSINQYLSKK